MDQRLLVVLLIACLAGTVQSAPSHVETTAQMRLDICLYDDSGQKILANPCVVAALGQPFTLHVGGTLGAGSDEDQLEIGTKVTGRFSRLDDKSYKLNLKISLATGVSQAHEAETTLTRSEVYDIRTTLTTGQTKTLECSSTHRCEITINPCTSQFPVQSAEQTRAFQEGDVVTVSIPSNDSICDKELSQCLPCRMAAVIVGVEANGWLLLEGLQTCNINGARQKLSVSGTIPPESIDSNRIVAAEQIHDFKLDMEKYKE